MWILLFPLMLGSLCCLLAIPLIMQKIPPNLFYGLRTHQTMSDKNLWYRANRQAGLAVFVSGLLAIAGAVSLWIWQPPISIEIASLMLSLIPLIPILIINLLSYRTKFWIS